MKLILKNSVLVFVLSALLVLPFSGFGFAGMQMSQTQVLGVQSENVNQETKINPAINLSQKIIDQVDLNLNLSKESLQKFYDVIPTQYVGENYQYIIIYPNKYKDDGIEIKTIKNEMSVDLGVYTNGTKTYQIPVSVLVVEN